MLTIKRYNDEVLTLTRNVLFCVLVPFLIFQLCAYLNVIPYSSFVLEFHNFEAVTQNTELLTKECSSFNVQEIFIGDGKFLETCQDRFKINIGWRAISIFEGFFSTAV